LAAGDVVNKKKGGAATEALAPAPPFLFVSPCLTPRRRPPPPPSPLPPPLAPHATAVEAKAAALQGIRGEKKK